MTDTKTLLPCPFCGGSDIEIVHTHTPSFWAQCKDCDCKIDGEYFPSPKPRKKKYILAIDAPNDPYTANSVEELPPEYQKSYHSAVSAWNTRTVAAPVVSREDINPDLLVKVADSAVIGVRNLQHRIDEMKSVLKMSRTAFYQCTPKPMGLIDKINEVLKDDVEKQAAAKETK